MSESSRSADSVKVGLCHLGEVEVNHHVDGLDVDTASEQVRGNQVATEA